MITLDDVAARAGVSRMTASNAIRGKNVVRSDTAQRVLVAAADLGYRPNVAAQQLSSGRTHVISVTLSDFDLIFPAKLAAEFSDLAKESGYQIVVQQTRFSEDYERAMLSSASMQICDGAIICWPRNAAADFVGFSHKHPLVMLDAFELEGRIEGVFTPCTDGAAEGIRHLIRHGAKSILVVGAPPELARAGVPPSSSSLRLNGALAALKRSGLPHDPSRMVMSCGWNSKIGYDMAMRMCVERGWHAGCNTLETLGFDAIFCICDSLAIGVLKALTDIGIRVPEDVMVMGFDAVEDGAYMTPALSSVAIDPKEMASECLNMLIERIEHHNVAEPRTQVVGYGVTARGSAERS